MATFQDFLGGKKLAERKPTTSVVESSDETLSAGEGSGKPCQYLSLMAEQKDMCSSPARAPVIAHCSTAVGKRMLDPTKK